MLKNIIPYCCQSLKGFVSDGFVTYNDEDEFRVLVKPIEMVVDDMTADGVPLHKDGDYSFGSVRNGVLRHVVTSLGINFCPWCGSKIWDR